MGEFFKIFLLFIVANLIVYACAGFILLDFKFWQWEILQTKGNRLGFLYCQICLFIFCWMFEKFFD